MKKVILVSTGDVLASIASKALLDQHGKTISIEAVVNSNLQFKNMVKILHNGIKKGASFYLGYMFVETYGLLLANLVHQILSQVGREHRYLGMLFPEAKKKYIPVLRFPNLNSSEAIEKIQSYNPESIICVRAGQILRHQFISAFSRIMNLHCTLLPQYRGIGGIFQALSYGERELGCTVHIIDSERVDAGPTIVQAGLTADASSLLNQTIRLYRQGQELLLRAIVGSQEEWHGNECGSYYSWPEKRDRKRFLDKGHRFFKLTDFSQRTLISR